MAKESLTCIFMALSRRFFWAICSGLEVHLRHVRMIRLSDTTSRRLRKLRTITDDPDVGNAYCRLRRLRSLTHDLTHPLSFHFGSFPNICHNNLHATRLEAHDNSMPFIHHITVSTTLLLALSITLLSLWVPATEAQGLPTQEDLCPDYREVDPLQECQSIRSYAGLKEIIEETPAGGLVEVCPFFVQKISSMDPIIVRKGVTVRCVRKAPDDLCIINGMGHQVWIDTDEDTLWQGIR